jgi:tetratricopeptide (TPR) repeat protein
MLDRAARARLRTLGKDNAERVARHLVAAGRLLDDEPERAYEHAQAAYRRAGRVDIVREAVGLTAYATGRYAEALRELRTARRLSGQDAHRAIEADCERGLGRPERALALVSSGESAGLPVEERIELALVASGARLDLGEPEAALAVLETLEVTQVDSSVLVARVAQARADVLEALGRPADAAQVLASAGLAPDGDEEVVVIDLESDLDDDDWDRDFDDDDPDVVVGDEDAADDEDRAEVTKDED